MDQVKFYSYKKLVIFGAEKTGKACFSKRLETDKFDGEKDESIERSNNI